MSTIESPRAGRSTGGQTVAAMALGASERFEGAAIRYHDGTGWTDVSYRELGAIVREIAKGLITLGVEPGERVAILSQTRPEWTYADLGGLCAGATVVPVYQTNSPEECEYVLKHSDARVVFCEDAEQVAKIESIRARLPELRHVVAFGGDGAGAVSLADLRAGGREVPDEWLDERVSRVSPGDPYTFVYTSGTTGPPKGCVLTHRNCRVNTDQVEQMFDLSGDPVFYMFLPLAHVLTREVQMVALDVGGDARVLASGPRQGHRGRCRGESDAPAVGAADLREDLYAGDERRGCEGSDPPASRGQRARASGAWRRRGAGPGRCFVLAMRSPTGLRSPRCAPCSAPACGWR